MPREYDQLAYNPGQFRHILNLCQMSRPGFARKWGIARNTVGTWVLTAGKIKEIKAGRRPIPEHACRMAKATLDLMVLEVENHIMTDIMLYKLRPNIPRLVLQHGVSKGLVSMAIKNLVHVGVLQQARSLPLDKNCSFFKEPLEIDETTEGAYERMEHIIKKSDHMED